MPQSERSRLRELFRRLTGWLRRSARKEPEPPSIRTLTLQRQKSPGHRIEAVPPWLSYRKTDLVRPTTAGKAAKIGPCLNPC
jgi:hypothetical protein